MTFDVVVVGGGPGGHAAALAARSAGRSVLLVEAERLGGQCVHSTCIPSGLMLGAATAYIGSQGLAFAGVFDVGDHLSLGRAGTRRDALVAQLARGIDSSLRSAGVEVRSGRAVLGGPGRVLVDGTAVGADAVVVATGARWEAPSIPGIAADRVVTLDAVLRLDAPPGRTVVVGGGPHRNGFSVEAAVLLAAAGSTVSYATQGDRVVEGLDVDVDAALRASMEALGVEVVREIAAAEADLVVAPDLRVPNTEHVGLESLGLVAGAAVEVDERGQSTVQGVYACGDAAGGAMTTASAIHRGRIAGANAAGGRLATTRGPLPYVIHTVPETAWVGLDEAAARGVGHDVAVGLVDIGWTARGITAGGVGGLLKLIADRELGRVLGVHAHGPGAAEAVAVAATAIQAELRIDDLAAGVHWHPSGAELIADAAHAALR